ncbi:MAG: acetyl-CoA carboxylase, carboxyltransferase subunit beta [Armatimonadota bacterium]|nr:acetyl-CoA carboxylase, carboxyltransferase subunit beta [Armatimonadota bacterium]MDR5696118.1 acetyl-CoA carboxylase, carboxyltransferase subunit beta [Armatimonadota bacterium]
MLNWLRRPKYNAVERRELPAGLWVKCPKCAQLVYRKELERNLKVCPKCGHHHRISGPERLALIVDEGTFEEWDAELASTDPLGFPNYARRYQEVRQRTGRNDAVITGEGLILRVRVAAAFMDFEFFGGSMGSVVGEKVTRMFERAVARGLPVVTFSASGGARMQEGALSLMQLAKTSAAVQRLHDARLPFVSVLCDPTTGGTSASFAMLGDVHIAEPGALIGFAGARVIEQTIRQKLPEGFQTAEFLLQHGMIDRIVPRAELKDAVADLLQLLGCSPETLPEQPEVDGDRSPGAQ